MKFISKTFVLFTVSLLASYGFASPQRGLSSTTAAEKPYYSAALTSNVAELVKGNGNVMIEFFSGEKMSGFFGASFSSEKERRPKLANAEFVVDRSAFTLGISWYKNEIQSKTNFLLAPGLSFGQEKDYTNTDAKTAFEILGAIQLIPEGTRLKLMAGMKMSNLTGDFKGTPVIALGAIF